MIFPAFVLVYSLLAGLFISTNAGRPSITGKTVAINSETEFCFFLPPPGKIIGDWEWNSTAFCTNPVSSAPGAQTFPEGFILSAHILRSEKFVQITGALNPNIYVVPTDQGGQYDNNSPAGASCAGYDTFVNLVEPANSDYCIRCCNGDDCPTGRSTNGCVKNIPGNYSDLPSSPIATFPATSIPATSISVSSILTAIPTTTPTQLTIPTSTVPTSTVPTSTVPTSTVPTSTTPVVNNSASPIDTTLPSTTSSATSNAISHRVAPAIRVFIVLLAVAVAGVLNSV